MFSTLPSPPTGNSFEANWMRRLLTYVRSLTPKGGRNHRILSDSDGWSIEQISGGGGKASIKSYKFVSMFSDYLVCHTWDGQSEGADLIKIAKPTKLQQNVDTEDIDGTTITYEYVPGGGLGDDQFRSASDGTFSEFQAITPRYLVGDVIFTMEMPFTLTDGGDDSQLTEIDINVDGRAWAGINNFAN